MLIRRLALALALLLAVVGGAGFLHRLRDQVSVVVTTAAVPAHTPLTADKLELRKVSRDALGTLAADAIQRIDDAAGLVTRVDLPAGEVVRRQPRLIETTGEGLPRYQIPDGMRLAGLKVDSQGAVAGRLNPGDRVDIIYTAKSTGAANPAYAETILQAVEVFSVSDRGKTPGTDVDVTILVTPEQAQTLALAKRSGGAVDLSIAPPGTAATGKPLPPTLFRSTGDETKGR